jgi:hypothetical protein
MSRDLSDPTPEEQNVVLISLTTLTRALKLVVSCEDCNPVAAEFPFDYILDRVTGNDPTVTEYVLEAPGKCPRCMGPITEKTFLELDPDLAWSGATLP